MMTKVLNGIKSADDKHSLLFFAGGGGGLQIGLGPAKERGKIGFAGSLIPLQLNYNYEDTWIGKSVNLMFSPADFKVGLNGQWSYRPRLGIGFVADVLYYKDIFPLSSLYGFADIGLNGDKIAVGGGVDVLTTAITVGPGFYVEAQHDIDTGETSVMFGLRWAHILPFSWISSVAK